MILQSINFDLIQSNPKNFEDYLNTTFGNKTPEELIPIIQESHSLFLSQTIKALNYGTVIGYFLRKVKEKHHYKFRPYLEQVGIKRQSAYNYLFMYDNREAIHELIKSDESLTLTKVFAKLKGKDEPKIKKKELAPKQKALPGLELSDEFIIQRKAKQAFFARLSRARKNKAINKKDLPEAIKFEEGKIQKANLEIEKANKRIEEMKNYRIIEGK